MSRTLSPAAHAKALAAARDLLVDHGIDGFTVEGVALRSGVAKTTIYRHFASTHELLLAALEDLVQPLPTPNTGSLRDDLVTLFAGRLDLANDERIRPLLLDLIRAGTRDPELQRVRAAMDHESSLPVRTVLELARGRGDLRPDIDLDLAVDLIEGPLFVHVFVRQRPLTRDELETLVDLAVRALELHPSLVASAPPH
jgi:AcrR family transcriptional regulator